MQPALEGDELPFLVTDDFVKELKSIITNRTENSASFFSIDALIPSSSVSALHPSCTPQYLVPYIAKIVRWMLGPSGIILRVGPGKLVCIHLSHRLVDPELVGLQVERSIKRIFKIPIETEGILMDAFRFNPKTAESEQTLIRFLSSL